MKKSNERRKDLIIAMIGFLISSVSLALLGRIQIQTFILKFGCYAGFFTFLIYILRLRLAAVGTDPDSNEAFKEYLKLGSLYSFILFISELPVMLASL